MTAQIINGKELAQQSRAELAAAIKSHPGEDIPVLAVILVGDNEASQIYVRNKKKAAAEVGIGCEVMEFASSMGENAQIGRAHV